MASSLFLRPKQPLDKFDFSHVDRLFVENRLRQWFGVQKKDGFTFNKLTDFFQKNYIEVQIKTFFWGLDTAPKELTFDWMHTLHALSVDNLLHEQGTPIPHKVRDYISSLGFVSSYMSSIIGSPTKASSEGINQLGKELIDADDEEIGEKTRFVVMQYKERSIFVVDSDTASQYHDQQQKLFDCNKDVFAMLRNEIPIHPAEIFSSPLTLIEIETGIDQALRISLEKISTAGLSPILDMVGYTLLNKNPFVIREKAERIINAYNQSVKGTENEKLDAIIIFIKKILNLHIWCDGNGRICAHHLLNILLIKNGLFPTFLDNNCLDAFTHEELRERIIMGMLAFKTQCRKDPGQLKKFREENNLLTTQLSDFAKAIINNDAAVAKKCLEKMVIISKEDLSLLMGFKQARIDWFMPIWNNLNLNKPSSFDNLLIKCIESANKPLLLSLLRYCVEQHRILSVQTYKQCLPYFDIEMFELCFSQREVSNQMVVDCIPLYRYPEVALRTINYCFSVPNFNLEIPIYLIEDLFKWQKPNIIIKFMEHDAIKKMNLPANVHLIGSITSIVVERMDLLPNEKTLVLQTIIPNYKLNHVDPLTRFSQHRNLKIS